MVYTSIVFRINTMCKLHIARIEFLLTFHIPPSPSLIFFPNVFMQTDRTHTDIPNRADTDTCWEGLFLNGDAL